MKHWDAFTHAHPRRPSHSFSASCAPDVSAESPSDISHAAGRWRADKFTLLFVSAICHLNNQLQDETCGSPVFLPGGETARTYRAAAAFETSCIVSCVVMAYRWLTDIYRPMSLIARKVMIENVWIWMDTYLYLLTGGGRKMDAS